MRLGRRRRLGRRCGDASGRRRGDETFFSGRCFGRMVPAMLEFDGGNVWGFGSIWVEDVIDCDLPELVRIARIWSWSGAGAR